MVSAPGSDLLPAGDRRLFIEQFEKDLEFFQLFFLLFNKSCPIKNIDLVWAEREPRGRLSLRHLGIAEALGGSCSGLLQCAGGSPHPAFCNIVNHSGLRENDSCGVSDRAAAARVRATGRAEVYRCHFGLVDIAVPVIVEGTHIATLYTGQVLRRPPTTEDFAQIRRDLAHLDYIDLAKLEEAYRSVAVVQDEDIANAVQVLEVFADYLANSWTRLAELIRAQQHKLREWQLAAKEFAYLVLEGGPADRSGLQALMKRLGLKCLPNRVMVMKPEAGEEAGEGARLFDLGLSSAIHAVDSVCSTLDTVLAVYMRKRGICVFFNDRSGRNHDAVDLHAANFAAKLLRAVEERSDIRLRIGIGASRSDLHLLVDSYQEACAALVGSNDTITFYCRRTMPSEELPALSERICKSIIERRMEDARLAVASLPGEVGRRLEGDLSAQRAFFTATLDSMAAVARQLGAGEAAVAPICRRAMEHLSLATASQPMQECYLRYSQQLLREVERLVPGKRGKIIECACRMIEARLKALPVAEPVSISIVAQSVGVSVSHLSRTFRQLAGETFEHYVMRKRVLMAQSLLLDPRYNIAEVAERFGFSDASYFARVFRKIAGCSPREFCENPLAFRVAIHNNLAGTAIPAVRKNRIAV